MKNAIPRYNFYKTKYGSELLIDVVDLQYTRKFLTQGKVHILTYYDITFITEGEGEFTIGNRTHLAAPGDVFFSKPGEVRSWDTDRIGNGHALIFEDTFLTSFFKDPLFVQHLPFFRMGKMVDLKSATKLFSVLLASKRPLITELADKLRLKYPLLPTISPCPTMRLEAIRSIIPISCRRYPKSV